ncbi:hypothetical protein ACNAW0_13700 [Micromonospora sp. SL1-18]|uniref:hypothetical protein n=1 Tax=Micromonospora sp. SL1-18 TaxID=3399128 RepID=UPI003A4D388D
MAALALVVLAGCGTPSTADQVRPSRFYPFGSAVYYTAAEEQVIAHKLEQATAVCMRGRGFRYDSSSAPAPASWSAPEPNNPYFLLDMESARIDGYGIALAVVRDRQRSYAAAPPTPDPQFAKALVGDQQHQSTIDLPDGSRVTVAVDACATKAREMVFGGDWDRLYYTIQALSNIVIERTGKDPVVTDALRAWSSCLNRSGYQAKNPEELREQIQARARAAVDDAAMRIVAKTELTTAQADAACQKETNLRRVTQKAQQPIEQQVLTDQFRRDLDQLRQRRQEVLGH